MAMKQEDCDHAALRFADGDYHVVCVACETRWAMVAPWGGGEGEFVAPEAACKGVGAGLSGEVRGKAGST